MKNTKYLNHLFIIYFDMILKLKLVVKLSMVREIKINYEYTKTYKIYLV